MLLPHNEFVLYKITHTFNMQFFPINFPLIVNIS